jgi:hypothetical protein
MNDGVLYRSAHLKVHRNGPWHKSRDVLVICFQYRQSAPHLDLPGFAEEFFAKFEIDAVFINCASNEWYQYPDLPIALSTVRSFATLWKRSVTYGSSMGAYAAIRFAAAIGAQTSISVGPQFSPRSAVIEGEHRFDDDVASIVFLHEDSYQASSTIDNYVIYDPLFKQDARHITEYQKTVKVLPIPIPCGGHTPLIPLVQCGMLTELLLSLMQGSFSAPSFRRKFRQARRRSTEYWRELENNLREHGRHAMATQARTAREALENRPEI